MPKQISRRKVLGIAASAATALPGANWVFALGENGNIVKAAVQEGDATTWTPRLFDTEQAEAVAALAETIIPRTDTPGARVHEFIDLELSLDEPEAPEEFLGGLAWLEAHCEAQHAKSIPELSPAEREELLLGLSDIHDSHPEENEAGTEFFVNLKERTIVAYYTPKEGRIELGLPKMNAMGKFKGCQHEGNDHTANPQSRTHRQPS